ncbi:PAS domain S-box protein [Marixanthomonas ophiurae]|uniref:histidine kinase n=1 Tax=Marixanthomonas ophiurae TaxID=387659 RepID=A0A3E1Q7S3_9FLAO|nr:PAS domain S-box protein [Marixanthomonas ophiurae]RFN58181.1 PAS domain S-box protein [Marixanthomonas ophiurae]
MTKAYLNLLDGTTDVVCILDTTGGTIQWLNANATQLLSSHKNSLLNKKFSSILKEKDKQSFSAMLNLDKNGKVPHSFIVNHRIKSTISVELNWSFIIDSDNNVVYGIAKNPLDHEVEAQPYYVERLERKIMEQAIDPSKSLQQLLNSYIEGLEDIFPSLKASILKVENNKVWHVASNSLPKEFSETINGMSIGPVAGSCGTAAYTKKRVIVSDIKNNPLWEKYKILALPLGLKACWSQPIFNADNEVVATFANYYGSVRTPSDNELKVFERSTSLIGIILEHHQKRVDLQSNNELFEYVNLATNDAIYDWNIQEDDLNWGMSFSRLFGYTVSNEKYPLSKWESLVHPEDLQSNLKSLHHFLNTPSQDRWKAHYRFKRANGEYAFVEEKGYAIRDANGKAIRMIGVLSDVTERKIADEKQEELTNFLKTSQKEYMDLFHSSPIPMWLYDVETYKFLEVNNAAILHYGYSREEFLSLTILDIRPKSEIDKVKKSVERLRSNHYNRLGKVFKHIKKNGDVIFVEVRGNKIEFNNKNAEVILATDITEKLTYIEAIENKNKRLKQIAWDQSHLVRAPLSRLMGIIDLIKNGALEISEKEELLSDILESAKEMDSTIKEISDKTNSN